MSSGRRSAWSTPDFSSDYKRNHEQVGFLARDFLLPRPNSARTGFIITPCTSSTVLGWVRSLLLESGYELDIVKAITLASLRVSVTSHRRSGFPGQVDQKENELTMEMKSMS